MNFEDIKMINKFKRRGILLLGALVFLTCAKAQSPYTNFSLATGFMKGIMTDDALSPYLFKGTNGLFRVTASRQKRLYEHNLQIIYGSITQKSNIQNTPKVSSQFYFLQYAFQRQIVTQKKTLIWMGPGLSTRVSVRDPNYNITGEAIVSLELCLKASRSISKSSTVEVILNLPLANFLVHREYGLSSDIEYKIVSWVQFHSFQLQFAYLLALNRNIDLVLGYDLLYYDYDFNESVRMVNQQYYGGFRINFKRNANIEK